MTHKHFQKLLGLFLFASFLLLICVEGFHHHEDGVSHNDCPLCVAAQQAVVISHHTSSLIVSHDVQIASCDSVPALVSLRDRMPSFVRGPPT